jgi:hypothetical protein
MNAYFVDSTISRPSDSFFHTSVYFGDDDPRPDEDMSELDEEKESMEDKYLSQISKLQAANKKLSLRLKEEFENSKKVYFGDDDPRPDEDMSELDEEKESMEDKYLSQISKLQAANKKLSLRLKEEFENSKKNINDKCTLILWVWDKKKKIFSEHEIGRKQIKLYSVSEPSIFDQMHDFFPWGLWDAVYLQKPYTNTCIYDDDEMSKLGFIQRLNKVKEGLRNLSKNTILNVYTTSKNASRFKIKN